MPTPPRHARSLVAGFLLFAAIVVLGGGTASAAPPDEGKPLLEQLRELRERLAKLEAALAMQAKPDPAHAGGAAATSGGGMGTGMPAGMDGMDAMMGEMAKMMSGMGKMMGMMMDADKGEMGGMGGSQPAGGMAGGPPMGMMEDDEMGMGPMPAKSGGAAHSALPGFPGASHLYHVGATGFFLDHPQHLKLTTEQQKALNVAKEKALLEKSTSGRKIDEAEQQLWTLTSADSPDAAQIETKVREIEGLRSEQRLAFIRAVGDAAKILTEEQRRTLTGDQAAPAAKPDAKAGH